MRAIVPATQRREPHRVIAMHGTARGDQACEVIGRRCETADRVDDHPHAHALRRPLAQRRQHRVCRLAAPEDVSLEMDAARRVADRGQFGVVQRASLVEHPKRRDPQQWRGEHGRQQIGALRVVEVVYRTGNPIRRSRFEQQQVRQIAEYERREYADRVADPHQFIHARGRPSCARRTASSRQSRIEVAEFARRFAEALLPIQIEVVPAQRDQFRVRAAVR